MPSSVQPSNNLITVHLTPMPGSIHFEAKKFRFRLGQSVVLGFECLGSTATPENGLFCAWAVHQEHARLFRDANDGLFYVEPLNNSTYVGNVRATGQMDIFNEEALQLGDANGRDKPVIARVQMTYH